MRRQEFLLAAPSQAAGKAAPSQAAGKTADCAAPVSLAPFFAVSSEKDLPSFCHFARNAGFSGAGRAQSFEDLQLLLSTTRRIRIERGPRRFQFSAVRLCSRRPAGVCQAINALGFKSKRLWRGFRVKAAKSCPCPPAARRTSAPSPRPPSSSPTA